MKDCLFCKILAGEIPANLFYQDDKLIAFDDINPKAPQHKLIVPRKHISTLNDITVEDTPLVGHLLYTGQFLAKKLNIAEAGYRLVLNCNEEAGQTVFHIHLHLLGGRTMHWPPG